jgi:hypothetical protein
MFLAWIFSSLLQGKGSGTIGRDARKAFRLNQRVGIGVLPQLWPEIRRWLLGTGTRRDRSRSEVLLQSDDDWRKEWLDMSVQVLVWRCCF